jgi:hypothetical protein
MIANQFELHRCCTSKLLGRTVCSKKENGARLPPDPHVLIEAARPRRRRTAGLRGRQPARQYVARGADRRPTPGRGCTARTALELQREAPRVTPHELVVARRREPRVGSRRSSRSRASAARAARSAPSSATSSATVESTMRSASRSRCSFVGSGLEASGEPAPAELAAALDAGSGNQRSRRWSSERWSLLAASSRARLPVGEGDALSMAARRALSRSPRSIDASSSSVCSSSSRSEAIDSPPSGAAKKLKSPSSPRQIAASSESATCR